MVYSGDMNSNTIFIFNWLKYHTFYLNHFRESFIYKAFGGFSFAESNGLVAGYPIGVALLTSPIAAAFYAGLKLFQPRIDILSQDFEPYRELFSHLAASLLVSTTLVCFYLISKFRYSQKASLISTICLGFATSQWGTLCLSLYQQGASSFCIVVISYLLLLASHRNLEGKQKSTLLNIVAGLLTGLLLWIRPTNLVFMAAFSAFAILKLKRSQKVPFFGISFLVAAGNLIYNLEIYHHLLGPYHSFISQSYLLTWITVFAGVVGILFNPSYGIFVSAPVLFFCFWGVRSLASELKKYWLNPSQLSADHLLFALLLGASTILFLNYTLVPDWIGSHWGFRYLAETMPVLCYFLNPFFETKWSVSSKKLKTLFVLSLMISIAYEFTGIYGGTRALLWCEIPRSICELKENYPFGYRRVHPERIFLNRIWDFTDTQMIRFWKGIYNEYRLGKTYLKDPGYYHSQCKVRFEKVYSPAELDLHEIRMRDAVTIPLDESPQDQAFRKFNFGRKLIQIRVKNEGSLPLFGYQSGVVPGLSAVVYRVSDKAGKFLFQGMGPIYTPATVQPGESALYENSIQVLLPKGTYSLKLAMTVNGMGDCKEAGNLAPLKIVIE